MRPRSWISSKVEIRKSRIHGTGLFAVESIKKDEVIAYKGGHLLETAAFKRLPDRCKSAGLQIDKTIFLAPIDESEVADVMVGINPFLLTQYRFTWADQHSGNA